MSATAEEQAARLALQRLDAMDADSRGKLKGLISHATPFGGFALGVLVSLCVRANAPLPPVQHMLAMIDAATFESAFAFIGAELTRRERET